MKDEETLDTPEQRMLHGLLTDLFDPSREARIRMAMKSMESSRPSILARVAAALLFMAAGAGAALLVMDRLPEARAVIDRATREAREATDRQYRVTVEALKPSMAEPVASGVLHVRGSEAFAIQFEAPFAKGWYGSDGRETWFRPAEGAVIRWPADQKASWKEREKLDFVQFESFLREHRDRFDVATIERRDGVLRVRATRKLTAVGEPIPQFEVWVSEKTGVMTRLQCRLDPELWHWDPWLVTIEHEKDLLHPSGYYAAESDSR